MKIIRMENNSIQMELKSFHLLKQDQIVPTIPQFTKEGAGQDLAIVLFSLMKRYGWKRRLS